MAGVGTTIALQAFASGEDIRERFPDGTQDVGLAQEGNSSNRCSRNRDRYDTLRVSSSICCPAQYLFDQYRSYLLFSTDSFALQ